MYKFNISINLIFLRKHSQTRHNSTISVISNFEINRYLELEIKSSLIRLLSLVQENSVNN